MATNAAQKRCRTATPILNSSSLASSRKCVRSAQLQCARPSTHVMSLKLAFEELGREQGYQGAREYTDGEVIAADETGRPPQFYDLLRGNR